ncbi:PREDICTED: killer cell lectin-like receptor subfamily G member 1 [Calidris pugnax]|uniref:killer cell lectin-like receptor subfamily G member 1 n=1 Tax=Calidris pugnax TaxID=198806 RepID=UPI00071C26D0|nr:PREDICTED: killer cell lectin-like receptor subfamily G member 1 [Calidris pugnax]
MNVEMPLSPQEEGASPHPKVPGATGRRKWVLVVSVLVALVLALAVAVAVLSARTRGGDPAVPVAPVLACPDGWVGYHNVCYYLSRDQGSWEWSQEQCSSRGASLAVLRREWEMVSEGLLWVRGGLGVFLGWMEIPGSEQSCVRAGPKSTGWAGELLQQLWSLLEQAWGGSCCHPRAGGSRVGPDQKSSSCPWLTPDWDFSSAAGDVILGVCIECSCFIIFIIVPSKLLHLSPSSPWKEKWGRASLVLSLSNSA